MDKKDLLKFRKEWLSEIENEKTKLENDTTEQTREESNAQCVNISKDEEDVQVKHNPKDGQEPATEISAFTIANKYLDISPKDCRFCYNETEDVTQGGRNNTQSNRFTHSYNTIRKRSSSGHTDYDIYHGKWPKQHSKKVKSIVEKDLFSKRFENIGSQYNRSNEETEVDSDTNYLDLLIADINEITCIPFFDLDLPKEIAVKIFQHLSPKDLANCCCVNKKWKIISEDDLIWYNLCDVLDIDQEVDYVAERVGWKQFVKESILERRRIQQKWKERFCEVRDLENEKGGILCSADMCNNHVVAAYLNGSIKIWDLETGSYGNNLKEQYTTDEDIVTSMCTCVTLKDRMCVAGFQNGDVMVWSLDSTLNGQLLFMDNYNSAEIFYVQADSLCQKICVGFDCMFVVISKEGNEKWNWNRILEKQMNDKITSLHLDDHDPRNLKIVISTRTRLSTCTLQNESITLESLIGATFSCTDYKNSIVVAGISSFGYSVLGGYRIRKYCLDTGKQISNIVGTQTLVTCLSYADCYDDNVVIGCADQKIRIYDFKTETLMLTICGIDADITTLQMDKWKVVSGHQDGTICLFDRRNGTMYWQTRLKHPVCICKFSEFLLTCVNIPDDKYPQNSYWYADDLIQHRRYRGSIRVMDFRKDAYTNDLPNECRAEYDNITGYDYNIELITPYDDVCAFNLPKI